MIRRLLKRPLLARTALSLAAIGLIATTAWGAGIAGSVDTTFGTNGVVSVDGLGDGVGMHVFASVSDSTGAVIAVGQVSDSGGSSLAARRYSAAGVLDTSYGTSGIALPLPASPVQSAATAAAIDADGRLLLVGTHTYEIVEGRGKKTRTTRVETPVVVRLLASGQADGSFGDSGVVRLDSLLSTSSSASNVTVLPDGDLLITGNAYAQSTTSGGGGRNGKKKSGGSTTTSRGLLLVRLNANGEPDSAFGSNGIVIDDRSTDDDGILRGGIALQSDGSIIVGGGTPTQGFVRRYGATGNLDPAFASGGEALLVNGTRWQGPTVAVDGFDRIVVALGRVNGAGGSVDGAVLRLTIDGALDETFASNGEYQTAYTGNDDLIGVRVRADGSIIATGSWYVGSARTAYVLKLTASGDADASFGTGGISELVPIPSSGYDAEVRSLDLDPSGDPIVAGQLWDSSSSLLPPGFVVRYLGN